MWLSFWRWWWWWGENNTNLEMVVAVEGKNKHAAVVEVYSFTMHGAVLK